MGISWYIRSILAIIFIITSLVCIACIIALMLYNYWKLLVIFLGCFTLGFSLYGEIRSEYYQKHGIKEDEMR